MRLRADHAEPCKEVQLRYSSQLLLLFHSTLHFPNQLCPHALQFIPPSTVGCSQTWSAVSVEDVVLQLINLNMVCAGSNWVDPPKRERKRVVNYAENEYFRQAMKSGTGPRAAGVRLPKMPQLQVVS